MGYEPQPIVPGFGAEYVGGPYDGEHAAMTPHALQTMRATQIGPLTIRVSVVGDYVLDEDANVWRWQRIHDGD